MTSRRQSKKTHVASAWVNTSRVIRLCHSRVMKWKDASKIPASFLNLPPPSVFLLHCSFSQPQRWNYANHVAINFSRRFSLLMTPFAQIAILTSKIRGKRTSFALKFRPATSLKKIGTWFEAITSHLLRKILQSFELPKRIEEWNQLITCQTYLSHI